MVDCIFQNKHDKNISNNISSPFCFLSHIFVENAPIQVCLKSVNAVILVTYRDNLHEIWWVSARDFWSQCMQYVFFSALCYCTAELLSWCRHPSSYVHRPCIDIVFSDTIKSINSKFWGKVFIHHISRRFLFCFFKILIFYIFLWIFFVFLTWDHMGEKFQTTSPLKVHNRFTPQN